MSHKSHRVTLAVTASVSLRSIIAPYIVISSCYPCMCLIYTKLRRLFDKIFSCDCDLLKQLFILTVHLSGVDLE